MKLLFRLIGICFATLIWSNVQCQSLKTYSGPFGNGQATYQYFENANLERIFHGKYTYTEKCLKIEGTFKNNLKEGTWKYTYSDNNCYNLLVVSENLTGYYNEGKMNGHWKYTYSNKVKSNNKVQEITNMTANFKNNNFYGYIFIDRITPHQLVDNIKIKGKFSKDGFLDSTWTINYMQNRYKFESHYKFTNGILHNSISRNLSNGEIIERKDSTHFISSLINNYDSTINISKVNNRYFAIKTNYLNLTKPSIYELYDKSTNILYEENAISNETGAETKTIDYQELKSILLFWINIHRGYLFKSDKGIDLSLIYPQKFIEEACEYQIKEYDKLKKQK